MKFNLFIKKYPNYDHNRFSEGSNGQVQFLFNGDEYNPFLNEKLEKIYYKFPLWHGNVEESDEDIREFLTTKSNNTFPKELILTKTLFGWAFY